MISENALTEIALWGPTGSGKSWLINAFAYSLRQINDHSEDFEYMLSDKFSNMMLGSPPTSVATKGIEDSTYVFSRIPKKNTPAHQISASVHRIVIHDAKGADTVNLMNSSSNATMTYSKYVIALLDPTLLSTPRNLSKMGYTELLNSLLLKMAQKRGEGKAQKLAICITKIDTLRVKMGDPYELLEICFGKEMHDTIRRYATTFDIKLFPISPAGWTNNAKENTSNFDSQTGVLLRPDNWKPYNVEAPFFWFFESSERERIKQSATGLSGLLFGKQREAMYIPYPRQNN